MKFTLEKSIEILERTPNVLIALLHGISDEWTSGNEGEKTWSPYDVVGHLIHGERTDWIPRAEIILSKKTGQAFEPFDRFAQFEDSKGKSMPQLLDEFKIAREKNIAWLVAKNITDQQMGLKGVHPVFGEVTLSQLLATWVAHDLNHITQVCRVMAKQYKIEVGPWIEYLRILQT